MKHQLLLVDIDDTLTQNLGMPPREFIPSQRLSSAVNKAIRKTAISFCTGRDKDTVTKICLKLKIKSPQIIEGGAKIINSNGKTLWAKYISIISVTKIFKIIKKNIRYFSVLINGKEIVNTIPTTDLNKITAILLLDLSKKQAKLIVQKLTSYQDIAFSVNNFKTGKTIYITNKLGTKAHGVKKLLEMLKVNKKYVIGVGDGNNDKAFLSECGLKLAMGNAETEVKKMADYIAPNVKNDGVAHIIEKFILAKS